MCGCGITGTGTGTGTGPRAAKGILFCFVPAFYTQSRPNERIQGMPGVLLLKIYKFILLKNFQHFIFLGYYLLKKDSIRRLALVLKLSSFSGHGITLIL